MKKIKLIGNILFEWKTSLFIVFSLFFIAMINLLLLIGKMQYLYYTKDFFLSSKTQNCLYYSPSIGSYENRDVVQERQKLQELPAIDSIVQNEACYALFDNNYINIQICDNKYIDLFTPVDKGKWLSDIPTSNSHSLIPAVVAGYVFDSINLGEEFEIVVGIKDDNYITEKIVVIGKKDEPAYFPSLDAAGSEVSIPNIFTEGHNFIFLSKQSINGHYYLESTSRYVGNYLIFFDPLSSETAIQETFSYLDQHGSYLTYDKLLSNTDSYINRRLRSMLPLPVFLCFTSSFSLVSITSMWITSFIKRIKIYYICGCNTRLIIILFICSCLIVGFFSLLMVSILILIYPHLFKINAISYSLYSEMIIHPKQIVLLLLYYMSCTFFSLIIPLVKISQQAKRKGRKND